MMLYQKEHSIFDDHFVVEHKYNFSFPSHIHRSYEFIIILSGELYVTVDNEMRILHKNECAFIFPNRVHSLRCEDESEHILFIFSPESIALFNKQYGGKVSSSPFFNINEEPLISLITGLSQDAGIYTVKGILYSICGIYCSQCTFSDFSPKYKDSYSLLRSILRYVEDNYKTKCSLQDMSDALGYNYCYISELFSDYIGISFNQYVNYLRVNYACYLLTDTNESIINISYMCGFSSLRSFNRNFRTSKGVSPTDFRNPDGKTSRG